MKHVKAILIIFVLMIIVILAVQNYASLTTPISFRVNFIVFKHETTAMPIAVVAVFTFIIGVLAMGIYRIRESYRYKAQIKKLMVEIKEKDSELNSLRNLPLTTEVVGPDETPDLE
jgi:uncharacterized integral membrane protein